MKSQLENEIRASLATTWPDIKINIYKMDEGYIAMDAISESFGPPYYACLDRILDILEFNKPKWYQDSMVSICPVTPDIFEGRIKEEGGL